jgi:D-alanyl-D-alanine carboxypeptidase
MGGRGRWEVADLRTRWARRAAPVAAALLALGACSGDGAGVNPPTPSANLAGRPVAPLRALETMQDRIALSRAIATDWLGPGVPGLVVVATDGLETEVIELGEAVKRPAVPSSATRPSRLASLTKTMVATVVMRLVEGGDLALDATVERVAPGLLRAGRRITVEELLSHTSHLAEVPHRLYRTLRPDPETLALRAVDRQGLEDVDVSFPAYRNSNYLVLGLLAERVTGKPLARLLRRLVFEPAGMTTARLAPVVDPREVVHGYDAGHDYTRSTAPPAAASGGVVASARDVDRFLVALFGGRLVGRETLAAMLEPHGYALGDWSDYGLGVAILDTPCGPAYGHSGRLPGYSTEMWVLPSESRRVVVIANGDEAAGGGSLATGVRDTMLCR